MGSSCRHHHRHHTANHRNHTANHRHHTANHRHHTANHTWELMTRGLMGPSCRHHHRHHTANHQEIIQRIIETIQRIIEIIQLIIEIIQRIIQGGVGPSCRHLDAAEHAEDAEGARLGNQYRNHTWLKSYHADGAPDSKHTGADGPAP